jgi:hypothetical protein
LIRRRFYLYQLRDDFRDRRDFITGRPNYVGGYEEWLARKASLETGVQNPIEQDDMTRPWRNGGAWRRSNSAGPGRESNPNRNNSQNNNYRRDSSPNYGQYMALRGHLRLKRERKEGGGVIIMEEIIIGIGGIGGRGKATP